MKANVTIEFTDEELKDYGWGLLVRGIQSLGKIKVFDDPQSVSMIQGMINQLINGANAARSGTRVPPAWGPQPPIGYGPMPTQQARVVPIQPQIVHDKCFVIEETRANEAGIGCHVCASFNAAGRTVCRHCGHELCCDIPGPVITPPPKTQM